MANPVKTLPGEKLLIEIGDGGSPEVFAHPCMINAERGLQVTSEINEFITPDCDDLTIPAFKEILKDGIQLSVSGGGLLHTTDFNEWYQWSKSDDAKNVRININVSTALGGGTILAAMKLTAFNLVGNRKENSTVEVTLLSHGTPGDFVPAP